MIEDAEKALKLLSKKTFVLEHSPNCLPNRFLVRLCSPRAGVIDKKSITKTRDILGFGETFEGAAQEVLRKQKKKKEEWKESFTS